ncbi:hypothetical protein ATANTOWER_011215 [Ataeniobius toweri]|uniref:Uncharacterized protein n=1 Tax=Ataeniobius toweri TaxID=208326 RepID=A0ABU7ANJ3_9TELE|nr:hypothetical protein [Ataeniobius toweri]
MPQPSASTLLPTPNPASQEPPKPNHQPACPPSNVNSPTTVEFPRREETQAKKQNNSPSKNCALPVSLKPLWKKGLFTSPALPRTRPLKIPILFTAPVLVPV